MLYADVLVVYSDFTKRILAELGFSNVMRIYPGINLDFFTPAPKNKALKETFDIQEDDIVLVYPGEYTRLGGTDALVEALLHTIPQLPNLKMIFACRIKNNDDIVKKKSVQHIFHTNGLGDNVKFVETVPNMHEMYNLADVVLFPVEKMGGKFDVPLTVIEAYASKKPVIISDLPV
jgi:glycosyltransferase involved in cell wall biosynthesis